MNHFNNEVGRAMVEFAIASMLFMMVIIGAAHVAKSSYQSTTLNYIASNAARWGTLGLTTGGLSRVNSIKQRAIQLAAGYNMQLANSNIKICPLANPNCTSESAGNPNDSFIIIITRPAQTLFAGWVYTPRAQAVGQNEP